MQEEQGSYFTQLLLCLSLTLSISQIPVEYAARLQNQALPYFIPAGAPAQFDIFTRTGEPYNFATVPLN